MIRYIIIENTGRRVKVLKALYVVLWGVARYVYIEYLRVTPVSRDYILWCVAHPLYLPSKRTVKVKVCGELQDQDRDDKNFHYAVCIR